MSDPVIFRDYLLTSFLVTVIYYNRLTETTWQQGVQINNCHAWDTERDYEGSDTELARYRKGFNLYEPELSYQQTGINPKRGDIISYDSKLWLIEIAEHEWTTQVWRVRCCDVVDPGLTPPS